MNNIVIQDLDTGEKIVGTNLFDESLKTTKYRRYSARNITNARTQKAVLQQQLKTINTFKMNNLKQLVAEYENERASIINERNQDARRGAQELEQIIKLSYHSCEQTDYMKQITQHHYNILEQNLINHYKIFDDAIRADIPYVATKHPKPRKIEYTEKHAHAYLHHIVNQHNYYTTK